MIATPQQVEKVCPVVLRDSGTKREILVFRHPQAGVQLVKGTREPGENPVAGALRELSEEAGIAGRFVSGARWSSSEIFDDQLWHFVHVETAALPDRFDFFTADDGGKLFSFFWWPLWAQPDAEWHEMFAHALDEVRLKISR